MYLAVFTYLADWFVAQFPRITLAHILDVVTALLLPLPLRVKAYAVSSLAQFIYVPC